MKKLTRRQFGTGVAATTAAALASASLPRFAFAQTHPAGQRVPAGLSLGMRHRRLPGRRRSSRRRPRTLQLGHLLPHARNHRQRRHRRRGRRLLSPLQARHPAAQEPRRRHLPHVHLLVARLPQRNRPAQPQGPGLLQPRRRRAAGQQDHPLHHALPLGSARGTARAAGSRAIPQRPSRNMPLT